MVAPKGNKFAAKPEPDRASVSFIIRVSRNDRARWIAAAKKARKTLSRWIRDLLNGES